LVALVNNRLGGILAGWQEEALMERLTGWAKGRQHSIANSGA